MLARLQAHRLFSDVCSWYACDEPTRPTWSGSEVNADYVRRPARSHFDPKRMSPAFMMTEAACPAIGSRHPAYDC
jgi:hypothetical protein